MASSLEELEDLQELPRAKKRKRDSEDDHKPSKRRVVAKSGPSSTSPNPPSLATQLLTIENTMCKKLEQIQFGSPITHIYNPLDYAAKTHAHFVSCYGNSTKKVLFVGMNPGPFGMAQNGVAFGDTKMVKEWLGIQGEVGKPNEEHPNRIIEGLKCSRSEVSGSRFWGLFKELCSSPHVFFKNCYVHNYCPLCFMNKTGKNITPPSLKSEVRAQLLFICDAALLEVIKLFGVKWVIGVGKFGADRAKAALKANCALTDAKKKGGGGCCGKKSGEKKDVERYVLHGSGGGAGREVLVSSIMHPSPINPAANKGWAQLVSNQLDELGLLDTLAAEEEGGAPKEA